MIWPINAQYYKVSSDSIGDYEAPVVDSQRSLPPQAASTVPLLIPRVIPDYLSTSPAGPSGATWGSRLATPGRYNGPSAGTSVAASPAGGAAGVASSLPGRVGFGSSTPIAAAMRTSASSVRSFAAAAAAVVGSFASRGSSGSPGGPTFSIGSFGRHHVSGPLCMRWYLSVYLSVQ